MAGLAMWAIGAGHGGRAWMSLAPSPTVQAAPTITELGLTQMEREQARDARAFPHLPQCVDEGHDWSRGYKRQSFHPSHGEWSGFDSQYPGAQQGNETLIKRRVSERDLLGKRTALNAVRDCLE